MKEATIFDVYCKRMIPKVVHTFWDGPLDNVTAACLKRMHAVNNGWEVRVGTKSDIPYTKGVENMKIQHQSDWYRLYTLYTEGGVWLDASCLCCDTLDKVFDLNSHNLQGFGAPFSEYTLENWAFATPKRHPLMLAWLTEFQRAIRVGLQRYCAYVGDGLLRGHVLVSHLPYLSCHAAYHVASHKTNLQASLRLSTAVGQPFSVAATLPLWEQCGMVGAFVLCCRPFHVYTPLIKLRGNDRHWINVFTEYVPTVQDSIINRHLPLTRASVWQNASASDAICMLLFVHLLWTLVSLRRRCN